MVCKLLCTIVITIIIIIINNRVTQLEGYYCINNMLYALCVRNTDQCDDSQLYSLSGVVLAKLLLPKSTSSV